jgi:hypothetical protein
MDLIEDHFRLVTISGQPLETVEYENKEYQCYVKIYYRYNTYGEFTIVCTQRQNLIHNDDYYAKQFASYQLFVNNGEKYIFHSCIDGNSIKKL